MGFAVCRFSQDAGCEKTGSQHWYVRLPDLTLNVPFLWKHYAEDHLIQPTSEERSVVLAADLSTVTGQFVQTRSIATPRELLVLYVERLGKNRYSHIVGSERDVEFISKLEQLLEKVQSVQTKKLYGMPGYR